MLDYDAAIVGAGPIGGYVANKIAKEKFKVALFEKKKQIGLPVNCAGLITPRVFDILDMPKQDIVQNEIKGANIHSPSNKILKIGGDKIHALVIDRILFDKQIIKNAEKNGAELYLNNNIVSAQKNNKIIELKTSNNQDVKCKILVGADGPFSKIRDRFIFPEPKEFLIGIGAEITNTNIDPDYVEIFVGNNIAPGFFAWIIPTNKKGSSARIGLCITKNSDYSPKHYFSNFLNHKNTHPYLENIEITKNIGGIIPLGILKKTYTDNVMLVGDAAAQVKPISGGGIYPGLLCAKLCSKVAIESLQKNDFSSQILKKYQNLWNKDIGSELKIGMRFRSIFKNLSDKQTDKYIDIFQDPRIIETINRYGDIDYPSKLVKPLLKKLPILIKLIPNLIKK